MAVGLTRIGLTSNASHAGAYDQEEMGEARARKRIRYGAARTMLRRWSWRAPTRSLAKHARRIRLLERDERRVSYLGSGWGPAGPVGLADVRNLTPDPAGNRRLMTNLLSL
jgi:hypothetical protein